MIVIVALLLKLFEPISVTGVSADSREMLLTVVLLMVLNALTSRE